MRQLYRQSHEQNGPAVLRFLELSLNGLEFCRRSSNPLLSEQKAALFARRCQIYSPLAPAVAEHAPSGAIGDRARSAFQRFLTLFPDQELQVRTVSQFTLRRAEAERIRHDKEGLRVREEPYRIYTYPGNSDLKPYDVTYPGEDRGAPFFISDPQLSNSRTALL